jgi:hypothetical protein
MDKPDPGRTLRRQEASDAVGGLGRRYVLGTLPATVAVRPPRCRSTFAPTGWR